MGKRTMSRKDKLILSTGQCRLPGYGSRGEDGATLVEMALICAFVVIPMLFGIIEVSLALYSYNFVTDAAREATRYAVVRGPQTCVIAPTFPDCNLSPAGSTNPTSGSGSTTLQTYVQNLGYPGINPSNLTVTATWWSANVVNPGTGAFSTTDWNTQCTTTDLNGNACNSIGNAVRVVVTYAFPLNIPFWKNVTVNLTSTAQMTINE